MGRDIRAPSFGLPKSAEIASQAAAGRTLENDRVDLILRSIVERRFATIGEGLNRLRRIDATALGAIPHASASLAFPHIRVHGYDAIDDETVRTAATDRSGKLITAGEGLFEAYS